MLLEVKGELERIYEEECRRLTEEAKRVCPKIKTVYPVAYLMSRDADFGDEYAKCLYVKTEGEELPYVYVIEKSEYFEEDLIVNGRVTKEGPLGFEKAKELFEKARVILWK